MRFLSFLFFLLTLVGAGYVVPKNLRALWNFEEVCECVLHYTALSYNNYGCWCGIGGGFEPVDGIDSCCRNHDHCYDRAIDEHKCFDVEYEYVDDYSWKCLNGSASCKDHQDPCKAALCECDTTVVKCWQGFPRPTSKPKCNHSQMRPYSKWFRV